MYACVFVGRSFLLSNSTFFLSSFNVSITQVISAASNLCPARHGNIEFLGQWDGTGICKEDIPLANVVELFERVVPMLLAGKKVLVFCRNGAHRSPFLCALFLVFTTAATPDFVAEYLQKLRNIVDMNSHHQGRSRRHTSPSMTPLQFLRAKQSEILTLRDHCKCLPALQSQDFTLNTLVAPSEFKRCAVAAGYVPKD